MRSGGVGQVFPVELAADLAVQDLQLGHRQIVQVLRERLGGLEVDPLGLNTVRGGAGLGIERVDRVGMQGRQSGLFLVTRLSRGVPD